MDELGESTIGNAIENPSGNRELDAAAADPGNSADRPKRRRSRGNLDHRSDAAAAGKNGAGAQAAAVSTLTVESVKATDRAARDRARRAANKSKESAQSTAFVLLTLLDGAVSVGLGIDAAMTDFERQMIEPPLTRMLARYTDLSDKIAQFSDPVMLLIGLGAWGARLAATRKPAATAPERGQPVNGEAVGPGAVDGSEGSDWLEKLHPGFVTLGDVDHA